MFLSEPSSEMNLQTTSRGVCVCVGGEIGRRRGGAGTGRTKRVDEHKGLSLDLEPVPGPFLVSFPFLSFASLRQWSEREINNLCTLSAAWGVAISSQGKPATLPVLARPTTPRRKCFLGGDSVDRAVTDSLSEETGSLHSRIGKYFQQSVQLFDHSGFHDSFCKEQMSIVIWLQLHHYLLLSHWLLSLSSQSSRPGLESLFLPCLLIPWLPGTSAAIRNWICILSVQCDCSVLPVSSHF